MGAWKLISSTPSGDPEVRSDPQRESRLCHPPQGRTGQEQPDWSSVPAESACARSGRDNRHAPRPTLAPGPPDPMSAHRADEMDELHRNVEPHRPTRVHLPVESMESTGVYWIALHEILERHGLELLLVCTRDLAQCRDGTRRTRSTASGFNGCTVAGCCGGRSAPPSRFACCGPWYATKATC
jgi:hypothetical protein